LESDLFHSDYKFLSPDILSYIIRLANQINFVKRKLSTGKGIDKKIFFAYHIINGRKKKDPSGPAT
jgi:hypothetical protein